MEIRTILELDDGPAKTAALAAWIQGLSSSDQECPVLVGGAAVELYTGGAYTTGDLDLVGAVEPRLEAALRNAGFERRGRHWVHESAQVFIEFPGSALAAGERAAWIEVEGMRVRLISAEDLLVDRLGAWQYWRSSIDGVNAFLLWQAVGEDIDLGRFQERLQEAGWTAAWMSLKRFSERFRGGVPPGEELTRWATEGP